MDSMKMEYWCNVNLRNKFFGWFPTDDLVYVGKLLVRDLDDAFRKFNRIDKPVPVLDEAEAPSMSVGDVIHVIEDDEWFTVTDSGFNRIYEPDSECLIRGKTVADVLNPQFNQELSGDLM